MDNLMPFHVEAVISHDEEGQLYIVCDAFEIPISREIAQRAHLTQNWSDFIINLDCHSLDELLYDSDLAVKMYEAYESNKQGNTKAAIDVLARTWASLT